MKMRQSFYRLTIVHQWAMLVEREGDVQWFVNLSERHRMSKHLQIVEQMRRMGWEGVCDGCN